MGFKSLITKLFILGAASLALSGCGGSDIVEGKTLTRLSTTDKYGTYYEIFPYSFADSNADGVGDIQGIIDKLDYIDSLNYDGIWLTPIHQSPSYHKYDVVDYKSIDSSFGTLDDYDRLVKACHDKGIKIILDLVINHSSSENVWFKKCLLAHSRNQTSNEFYNYYNIAQASGSLPSGWRSASSLGYSSLVYEGQFTGEMPDFNLQEVLDNPDGSLASSLKDVMRFWLIDHKVDGFRLDAVTSYFTGNIEKNGLFLKWLHDYCSSISPDSYIVGEGSWSTPTENLSYQTASGVDSFFNFEDQGTTGYPARIVNSSKANLFASAMDKNLSTVTENGLPAPFVANHDTGRLYAAGLGSQSTSGIKLLNAVLQMFTGVTFSYYGDEAGMTVLSNGGKFIDQDKRQPMPWGDSYTCKPVAGSIVTTDTEKYPLGTIKSQLEDKDSLISFVAQANLVRRAFPSVARGKVSSVFLSESDSFAIIKKVYKDQMVYIAINTNKNSSYECSLSAAGLSSPLEAEAVLLANGGSVHLNSNTLSLPKSSIALFSEKGSK